MNLQFFIQYGIRYLLSFCPIISWPKLLKVGLPYFPKIHMLFVRYILPAILFSISTSRLSVIFNLSPVYGHIFPRLRLQK